jgi:integrase
MPAMHLTKSVIAKLPLPPAGQALYRDDKLRGFAVRVTAGGTKAYVLEKLIHRRVRRITIARCEAMPPEAARKLAQKLLGEIAVGRNPADEHKRTAASGVTLGEVFADYLRHRSLAPKSVAHYRRIIDTAFADWQGKPLAPITREGVLRRFNRLRDEHGPVWANVCMRLLRAIINFAHAQHADGAGQSPFAANPVRILSQTKAWSRIERRRNVIAPHQLATWYRAVNALNNTTSRDYLLLLLFTGLRRSEAAALCWSDVDLVGRTLTIQSTKSGRSHTLPLPRFLHALLEDRRRSATGPFVFPGEGRSRHLVDLKGSHRTVIEASGVSFTLHDLRRTFATTAESLDVSAYALKRLLNHADTGDVTRGYAIVSIERLRAPMEKIADYLASAMGITPTKIYSLGEQPHAAPQSAHAG